MKRSSVRASPLSVQSLEALVRLAPVGIFLTDSSGRITFINDRWTEISGLSAAGNLGHGWTAAIHPDDRDRVMKEWLACTSEGRPCTIDYRIVHPSGEVRFVEVRGVALFTPSGRPCGLTGALEETTDRVDAERELRESLVAILIAEDHAVVRQMPCLQRAAVVRATRSEGRDTARSSERPRSATE